LRIAGVLIEVVVVLRVVVVQVSLLAIRYDENVGFLKSKWEMFVFHYEALNPPKTHLLFIGLVLADKVVQIRREVRDRILGTRFSNFRQSFYQRITQC